MRLPVLILLVTAVCTAQVYPFPGPASRSPRGGVAPALINECSGAAQNVASCSMSATGATVFEIVASYLAGASCGPSDSQSNSWTSGTSNTNSSSGIVSQAFRVFNPSTSGSQTFEMSGTGCNVAFTAFAFSGTFSGSLDKSANANNSSGSLTTLATGSTGSLTGTPNEVCLLGASFGSSVSSPSVNSSFHSPYFTNYAANNLGEIGSYLIPSSNTALNVTISWTGSSEAATIVECLK
jgi:hypothetical protein